MVDHVEKRDQGVIVQVVWGREVEWKRYSAGVDYSQ